MSNEYVVALANIERHRDAVRLRIQRLIHELERRALEHDLTKLAPDEVLGFCEINRAARSHAYGSPEYDAALASAKGPDGCITLHFARNSHHPEYHGQDWEMGWLDLIEMVLDWSAAAATYGKNTLRDGIEKNRVRFNFTPKQWWLIEQVIDWIEPAAALPQEGGAK